MSSIFVKKRVSPPSISVNITENTCGGQSASISISTLHLQCWIKQTPIVCLCLLHWQAIMIWIQERMMNRNICSLKKKSTELLFWLYTSIFTWIDWSLISSLKCMCCSLVAPNPQCISLIHPHSRFTWVHYYRQSCSHLLIIHQEALFLNVLVFGDEWVRLLPFNT